MIKGLQMHAGQECESPVLAEKPALSYLPACAGVRAPAGGFLLDSGKAGDLEAIQLSPSELLLGGPNEWSTG
jgi:hypothetical protein